LSPQTDSSIQKLLKDEEAWWILSEEERQNVIKELPAHWEVETEEKGPRIKGNILNSDSDWRSSLRQFQESLADGKLAPRWQAAAAEAMECRAQGQFDDWKATQYEEFWGQKQRLQSGVVASGSSRMKMVTLVGHGILKVGDVWSFSRAIRQPHGGTLLIEKEAKVSSCYNNRF
jgi:hypothetical protein